MPAPEKSYNQQVKDDGFVVIRNFLTPEEVHFYREASEKAIKLARDGKWSEVRIKGKQFPPWPKSYTPDIWGVSSLMHPDLPDGLDKVFQKFYSSDKLLDAASQVLNTTRDNLVMELMNMLINPLSDYELEWHRDDIKPTATAEEEMEKLVLKETGTQFNLALYEDECLIVVPGSHKRARTPEERAVTADGDRISALPNQLVVKLQPGDCAFYNNNILHRARYFADKKRITLHGSYGHAVNGKSRSMNVLQHGVANWLPRFEPVNDNLAKLKEGLQKLVEENKDKEIVYSLDG